MAQIIIDSEGNEYHKVVDLSIRDKPPEEPKKPSSGSATVGGAAIGAGIGAFGGPGGALAGGIIGGTLGLFCDIFGD
jgi:hypothetical protein